MHFLDCHTQTFLLDQFTKERNKAFHEFANLEDRVKTIREGEFAHKAVDKALGGRGASLKLIFIDHYAEMKKAEDRHQDEMEQAERRRIEDLAGMSGAFNDALVSRETAYAAKDKENAELKAQATVYDEEIASLKADIAAKDSEVTILKAETRAKDAEIAKLKAQLESPCRKRAAPEPDDAQQDDAQHDDSQEGKEPPTKRRKAEDKPTGP